MHMFHDTLVSFAERRVISMIKQFLGHLHTINHHKWLVTRDCIRVGLISQGLKHDLSKYAPIEFFAGVKYYEGGKRSPINREKEEKGYSQGWLHHKGRNRHHFEYWIDYCIAPDGHVFMGGCKMPKKYVAEMFCDRIAACRVYQGEKYTDASAYDYYQRSKGHVLIHPETSHLIDEWLLLLKERGEDEAFRIIREDLKKSKTY